MNKRLKAIICILLLSAMLLTHQAAAEEPDPGIIDADRLNTWMDEFVSQYKLNDGYRKFSVGFCYTGTGDSWFYNADEFMYSASLYKVPVSMLMAEREAAGELTQESSVMGSTLQYLESTALTYSNNYSGHAMVDYLGGTYAGKCADLSVQYTDLPAEYFNSDFYDLSYYTARYMTQVMETLYRGGEERFPHVISYLLPASPGEYYRITLSQYEIAQKYGSYEEGNGNKNEHCTAIIYTPTPIIVTVMTRNVGDYQKRISEVGAYLAAYALELDALLPAYLEAEEQQDVPETEAPEELPVPDPPGTEEPSTLSQEVTPVPETAEPDPTEPVQQPVAEERHLLTPALKGVLIGILLIAVIVILRGSSRMKAKKNAPDYSPRH